MTTKIPDFEADALVVSASDAQLKSVSTLADKLVALQDEERTLTDKLAGVKERRRKVEEVDLPEAMDACNMRHLKLSNGYEVVVESIVAGSIKKDNETAAFAWLREHGHGDLIKSNISVALSKGQDGIAAKIQAALAKFKGVEVVRKESVHAQTLGAWAREMVSEGADFPKDLLGIWMNRRAKVVAPKS